MSPVGAAARLSGLRLPGGLRQRNLARALVVVAIVVAAAGLPPLQSVSSYDLMKFENISALVMIAIGLNVVTGYAGQLSLGPSAIFAASGYLAASLAKHSPEVVDLGVMCLLGMAAAAVVGLIAGVPALRVSGFYLGMITLFLALLVQQVVSGLDVAGANNGITLSGPPFDNFTQDLSGYPLYEVTIGVILALVLVSGLLLHSRIGKAFVALRTSQVLAESLGIRAYPTKLLAFLLSAIPAGLGGAFYVYTQRGISPGPSISPLISINLLAACVIGGFGTVWGPVVGSVLVLGLDQYGLLGIGGDDFTANIQEWQFAISGVILIVVILLFSEGLVGLRPAEVVRRVMRRPRPRVSGVVVKPAAAGAPPMERCVGATGSLQLAAIVKRFGGNTALDGVDLELRPGVLHALIGPNGSGKTTLLNIASGFYAANQGRITIGGAPVGSGRASQVARTGVARTFQTPKLVPGASVIDNVLLAAYATQPCLGVESVLRLPRGWRADRAARRRALACLAHAGLEDIAQRPAGSIPHGTQRLVEIVRAIAADPLFLLLDEPAAGLSPVEIESFQRLIRSMAGAGVGVLLVEHNVPLVLGIADEVTVLHRGRRIAHGEPAAVRRDPDVMRVYLGAA